MPIGPSNHLDRIESGAGQKNPAVTNRPDTPADENGPEATPNQPRMQRRLLVVFVVAVGLLSAVTGWKLWPDDDCGGALSGGRLNSKVHSECIGVTDGSYLFHDPSEAANDNDRRIMEKINEIQRRITDENRAVAASSRYVKVVLLMPLTTSHTQPSAIPLNQILYSLQGTYTALYRANHSSDFGDSSTVKIQLLLANQGSRQEADTEFLDNVIAQSEPDHPVDAVVGLGSSIPNTEHAVDYLGQHGIPMVSAIASADNLTKKQLLWSVSPSNEQYVARLRTYLDHEQNTQNALRSGVIVYDRNPDLYTLSLRAAYQKYLEPYLKFTNDQAFRGSTLDQPNITPGVFAPVVTNLCAVANDRENPLDMVFFAGRQADFDEFAAALKSRICTGRPLTVLLGDTGFTLSKELQKTLRDGNVKMTVAVATNSPDWVRNAANPPRGFTAFLDTYRNSGFSDTDLIDGYAIAHHDALVTAVRAIRLAGEQKATQAPNPDDVATQFAQLNYGHLVEAASGTLSYRAESGRAEGQKITPKPFG